MQILLTEPEYNKLKERDTFNDSDLKLFEVKQKMETLFSGEPEKVIEITYSKSKFNFDDGLRTKITISKQTLENMLEALNSDLKFTFYG